MSFCPYCGTKLADGAACTCSDAVAAQKAKKAPDFKKVIIPIVAITLIVLVVIVVLVSRSKSKIELSEYIVIEGVSGLNGNGTLDYYLDEDRLMMDLVGDDTNEEITEDNFEAVMLEQFQMYEEIGDALSCVTLTATADENLSNGDTVSVAAVFENAENYDFSFILVDGSLEYTVSGLRDGTPTDAFAEGTVSVEFAGVNGEGQATLVVIPQDEDAPSFQYFLSPKYNLSNGDIVVVSVEYSASQFEKDGFLAPPATEKEFVVSGLTEYFSASDGLSASDLQVFCDAAVATSKEWEASEAEDDMNVTSPTTLVGAYFVEVEDPNCFYKNYWYGLEFKNAVIVVTNYATESAQWSSIKRNYWIAWAFPDCMKDENGGICCDTEDMGYLVFRAEDQDEFYADFCAEFEGMNITELECPEMS